MIHEEIRGILGEERYRQIYSNAVKWGNKMSDKEFPIVGRCNLDEVNKSFSAWAGNKLSMDLTGAMREHDPEFRNKGIRNPFSPSRKGRKLCIKADIVKVPRNCWRGSTDKVRLTEHVPTSKWR